MFFRAWSIFRYFSCKKYIWFFTKWHLFCKLRRIWQKIAKTNLHMICIICLPDSHDPKTCCHYKTFPGALWGREGRFTSMAKWSTAEGKIPWLERLLKGEERLFALPDPKGDDLAPV